MARKRTRRVNAGETFLVAHPYNHLYVVCSDPAQDAENIVLVNFTTFEEEEESCCIIDVGEHPFVKRRTCIRYKDARCVASAAIERLLDLGKMMRCDPVSPELLARIRNGASESDFIPEGCRRILATQNFI